MTSSQAAGAFDLILDFRMYNMVDLNSKHEVVIPAASLLTYRFLNLL